MGLVLYRLLDNAERTARPRPRSASPASPLVGHSARGALASRATRRRRWTAVLTGRLAPAGQDRLGRHAAAMAALERVVQRIAA